jgi:starch phosphorylase
MAAEDFARARELAAWKARVETAWPAVGILDVEGDVTAADIGDERNVRATVRLGDLAPSDVCVQLAHGRVGASGELEQPKMIELSAGECEGGVCTYSGSFSADRTGLYGMAVRVVPDHPELTHKLAMGLVAWA